MALRGYKVIEFAGLAPAPFCGMILGDYGATVTRIDKPFADAEFDTLCRGKQSLSLDIKEPASLDIVKKLCLTSDVIIDPFRPGVLEKLHMGPDELCKLNPSLIFARLTGYGQHGPFAEVAGHDINYVALSGVLSMLGNKEKPQQPLNLMGDFCGGGLMCALGICLALLERQSSGKGQVIDASMVHGSAYVSSFLWTSKLNKITNKILWLGPRGTNILDGGTPFYRTYETKDNKFMAVGALESHFYEALCKGLEIDQKTYAQFGDWEKNTEMFAKLFRSKTQKEWSQVFDFANACVTPVLEIEDAHLHPQNAADQAFMTYDGGVVPLPAPKLSRTPGKVALQEPSNGQHSIKILQEIGYSTEEISTFVKNKVVFAPELA